MRATSWIVAMLFCTCMRASAEEVRFGGACGSPDSWIVPEGRSGRTYAPAIPTPSDSISLFLSGEFGSTGYSFTDTSIHVSDDSVFVNLYIAFRGFIVLPTAIPWSLSACLPPFDPGLVRFEIVETWESPVTQPETYESRFTVPVIVERPDAAIRLSFEDGREVAGSITPGRIIGVQVLADPEVWSGSATQLFLGFDRSALDMGIDETAHGCVADLDGFELTVDCDSWDRSTPIVSLRGLVTEGFEDWTDLQIDSLETGDVVANAGNTIRLSSLPLSQRFIMDFNNDGRVGFDDFFMFADGFGSANSVFDFDRDGIVDFDDFFLFADYFGRTT